MRQIYAQFVANLTRARSRFIGARPMTLSEKILYSHLHEDFNASSIERGSTYLKLMPGTLLDTIALLLTS